MIGRASASIGSRISRRIAYTRARQDLQRDLERVLAGSAPAVMGSDAGAIGIATLSSGPWHLVLEILLGHALRLRGARPELLVCDLPALPICDERTITARAVERCAGCLDDKRALLAASELPWRGLSSLVAPDAVARAVAAVAAATDAELAGYRERGWPIGDWLHVSACHYLRRDARGGDAEQIDARRRLLASAIVTVEAVDVWLDQLRPRAVIVESGAHFMWRIVRELAGARGIPVVAREMGKGGWDQHLYALNADSMSPDLANAWISARATPLTVDEERAVEAFAATLPQRTYVAAPTAVGTATGATRTRAGARTLVAFANVTWDLATAGRDVAFTGIGDWLRDTLEACAAHPAVHLIVRAHPAEASVATRERVVDELVRGPAPCPANVTLVAADDPVPAAALCDGADLVAVYNSTAGLEAAIRGRPVLVCGDPHFRGRGFTIDIGSRDAYRALLSQWASGAAVTAPPDAVTLARRYLHLFFLRYHVPMGWTTSPLEPPFALTIRAFDELAPGRNPMLDLVCDGILAGRQILLPRELAARTGACAT